ncbi:DUF6541 family protein [Canibacter zhoujuaniae]|uniref:DUF6541 family protein n=1 Tax=Canibacter zhoujuaniae TaxID=2708343 RepID=UPI001420D09D|nr:DUF6541 family protein [Canibacter zhoujuaniae]
MSWLAFGLIFIVSIAVITIPGLLTAISLRLTGIAFWACSIAASFAVIGISTLAAGAFAVKWNILLPLIVGVIVGIALLPFRRWLTHSEYASQDPRPVSVTLLAVVPPLVTLAVFSQSVINNIGDPENFSRSFDNLFHLNAVTHILEGASPSPLNFSLTSTDGTTGSFYPTLWHATVALISQLSGASVAAATNGLTFAVAGIVWPVAILFFVSPILPNGKRYQFATALLAGLFPNFPYHLLSWGILYPSLLGTALIPIALGAVLRALNIYPNRTSNTKIGYLVFAAGAFGASAFAHPSSAIAALIFMLPLLVTALIRSFKYADAREKYAVGALTIAVVSALTVAFVVLRTGDNDRQFNRTPFIALAQFLFNTVLNNNAVAVPISLLTVSGLLLLILMRKHIWLIVSWAISGALYIVAVSFPDPLRTFITGIWYNDAHRLAAYIPIFAIPLAAITVGWIIGKLSSAADLKPVAGWRESLQPAIAIAVVFGLLFSAGKGASIYNQLHDIYSTFADPENIAFVSDDELQLLKRLPDELPEDALIAGNPWTGTSFAQAISNRDTLFKHLRFQTTPENVKLAHEFATLPAAEACTLTSQLGITHMLDFGPVIYEVRDQDEVEDLIHQGILHAIKTEVDENGEVVKPITLTLPVETTATEFDGEMIPRQKPINPEDFPGLNYLDRSPILTQIDAEGDAKLYEITGCN